MTGRETFGPLKSPYQCAAKDQKVTGYGSVDNVVGTHVANKNNSDVKLISLKKIKTERIPKNIHKFFPNLEGIFAFSMGLKTVGSEDFKYLPKLKYLDMGNNRLDTLPSNLFEKNPDLEWIDFSSNYLRNIGVKLLDPLTKLNFANFEENRCVDRRAQDRTNLHELELVLKSLECRLDDA